MSFKDFPSIYCPDAASWRAWLNEHYDTEKGIWLIYYKKQSGKPRVSYAEAVEQALCFGWIDSVPNKIDENSYKQFFSPRNPKSNWSKLNKDRVENLLNQNLMGAAGLKSIEIAKQNGCWNALDEVEALILPQDLADVFAQNPDVKNIWDDKIAKSLKRGLLEQLLNCKRIETRLKKINEIVEIVNRKATPPNS